MLSSFSHFSSPFPSQSIIIERSKTSRFQRVVVCIYTSISTSPFFRQQPLFYWQVTFGDMTWWVLEIAYFTAGQIIIKSPGQKNSWNQINQFHGILFWPNSIFCNFQNGQKSIFQLGKRFKTTKYAISRKKFLIYLISWVFLLELF